MSERPVNERMTIDLKKRLGDVACTEEGHCYVCAEHVGGDPDLTREDSPILVRMWICESCWRSTLNAEERASLGLSQ